MRVRQAFGPLPVVWRAYIQDVSLFIEQNGFVQLRGCDHVDKPGKLEMLRSIGADHVIDYAREDFTKNGKTYDVILDTIGKSSFSRSLRSLKANGTYLNARPGLFGRIRMRWIAKNIDKRVITWTAGMRFSIELQRGAL